MLTKNREMRETQAKTHLHIDPTQNQANTHQRSALLESGKAEIKAQERENEHQNEIKNEKQSKHLSTYQSEKLEEKSKTYHENLADEEFTKRKSMKTRAEERELEGGRSGGGMGPRERLKRHRTEVAGQVWIPDMWGQEELLMDWIDCNAFDSCLVPKGIISARAALIEEGRRATSGGIAVENSC